VSFAVVVATGDRRRASSFGVVVRRRRSASSFTVVVADFFSSRSFAVFSPMAHRFTVVVARR